MSKSPSENTDTLKFFRAYMNLYVKRLGVNKTVAAKRFGIGQSQFNEMLNGKRGISIYQMEKICSKMRINIVDALIAGRSLCGQNQENCNFTPTQIEAIEAFKSMLTFGGEAAEMIVKIVIELAEKKRTESEMHSTFSAEDQTSA